MVHVWCVLLSLSLFSATDDPPKNAVLHFLFHPPPSPPSSSRPKVRLLARSFSARRLRRVVCGVCVCGVCVCVLWAARTGAAKRRSMLAVGGYSVGLQERHTRQCPARTRRTPRSVPQCFTATIVLIIAVPTQNTQHHFRSPIHLMRRPKCEKAVGGAVPLRAGVYWRLAGRQCGLWVRQCCFWCSRVQ